MSINTANTPDGKGVLIYNGEMILLYCKGVVISFPNEKEEPLKKSVSGSMYLTSHRVIFISENSSEKLKSLSMPFHCMVDVKILLPLFGANFLKGYVTPQPGGNLNSEVAWKVTFNNGGCTDFGRALLKASDLARAFRPYDAPPAYNQPQSNVYAPPPEYYMAPNGNMCGFQAPVNAFPDAPPTGSVFIYDEPPPYSGIGETTTIPQFPENSGTTINRRVPPPSAPPRYEDAMQEAPLLPNKSKVE
uniref:GRAM domain-containing protein n=1 Tax=Parastrongyloides trichosuri TaxID=131310 RepID=A0A0N5A3Q7_PARTI